MFPSNIFKIRLLIFVTVCFLLWKTVEYILNSRPVNVIRDSEKLSQKFETDNLHKRIIVSVYYEALCSDSRNFIIKQLVPTYEKLSEYIELDLIPYGKATTEEKDGTYIFNCQHSHFECDANKVHACVLDQPFSKSVHLNYIACMIEDNMTPHKAGKRCAEEMGVDYTPIRQCADGLKGSELLKDYGVRTSKVNPIFIPTIHFDHSSDVPLVDILKNLEKEICHLLKHNTPPQCL